MTISNLIAAVTGGGTKTIAVMGATGSQGGSVIRAFHSLPDSNFKIRAITRNPESEKAKAIESMVDEVVKADGENKDSMVAAFKGCHGVFVVSNFWEGMDVRHEMRTLRTIKDALKLAKVKHVVLSTLPDTRKFVDKLAEDKDSWTVLDKDLDMYTPHYDGKAEVGLEYAAELPTTRLYVAFYMENFINFGMGPSRQVDTDPYAITLPMSDAKLAMVAVRDIGKCVCAIFEDKSMIGKFVGVHSEALNCKEIAEVFTKVCGQPVQYNAVPTDVYAKFDFPGADDLANMFRFFAESEPIFIESHTPPASIRSKMGGTSTFEGWLTANKTAFDLQPMVEKKAPS
jgi:uncharacterized protein YbjT (DUF2867 family)